MQIKITEVIFCLKKDCVKSHVTFIFDTFTLFLFGVNCANKKSKKATASGDSTESNTGSKKINKGSWNSLTASK
jgi:hypothetical protein